MKNYWKDILGPAKKEMLALIKAKVLENGGRIAYEDETYCVPILADTDSGENMCTLYSIEVQNGDLIFIGYECGEEFIWNEERISVDALCQITETIEDAIKQTKEMEEWDREQDDTE